MVTGINESKTLTKYILCISKCKFDGRNCNSNQRCNNDKYRCECKNIIHGKRSIFEILYIFVKMEKN